MPASIQAENISPTDLRLTLLHIMLAVHYTNKYADDNTPKAPARTTPEITKTTRSSTAKSTSLRGILNLKLGLNEYNLDHRQENSTGSASYVNAHLHLAQKKKTGPSKTVSIENLRKGYNRLIYDAVNQELTNEILSSLGEPLIPDQPLDEKLKKVLYHQKPCKALIGHKFGAINPFTIVLNNRSSEALEPTEEPEYPISFNGINRLGADLLRSFVESGQELMRWSMDFDGPPRLPTSAYRRQQTNKPVKKQKETVHRSDSPTLEQLGSTNKPVLPETPVEQSTITDTPRSPPEYCFAHYLKLNRQPTLAIATLHWQDNTLVAVDMEQLQGFRRGMQPLQFDSLPGGCVESGQTVFVILRERAINGKLGDKPFQMQICMTKDALNWQRHGIYSSLLYSDKRTSQVSSAVVLQTVQHAKSLQQMHTLGQWLMEQFQPSKSSAPANPPGADDLLPEVQAIRYRILGQMVNVQVYAEQKIELQRNEISPYVGHYACYYMRLAKSKFETSYIYIRADGTVLLRQPQDNNGSELNGYIRLKGNRLWIYLHHDLLEGGDREPIRFMLDNTGAATPTVLKGIFSSETKQGNWLVSGRMLMKKIADYDQFRAVETDYTNVTLADFEHEDDLAFFIDEQPASLIRTDGPFWADIAKRLAKPTAFDKLRELCTDLTKGTGTFNNNQFYYYTFKADPTEPRSRDKFVIERNLVTFLPNGLVTIHVGTNKFYRGYAYHLRDTLRLSLSEPDSGFFELFLELRDDVVELSNIKILYGMSLWHSSSHIQGKMVVLSRFSGGAFSKEAKLYRFTPDQRQILEDEDRREGGVISYLRGEINRYMHATTDSSPQQFRPRDQSFREIHFLIACFYGYQLTLSVADDALSYRKGESRVKLGKTHLKQAYIHGFACKFAGLKLTYDDVIHKPANVTRIYSDTLLTYLPDEEARRNLLEEDTKTAEILKRLRQVADEQRFLKQAFDTDGPLDHEELRNYARRYWPDLLP